MNRFESASGNGAATESLTRTCLTHLAKEERLLEACLQASQELRAALVAADHSRVLNCLDRYQSVLAECELIRFDRERLQRELGDAIGTGPEAVKLGDYAELNSGPDRESLLNARGRLLALSRQLENENRVNSQIIRLNLEFSEQFFTSLARDGSTGSRYDQTGLHQPAGYISLVSGRG